MTRQNGDPVDDEFWRRPAPGGTAPRGPSEGTSRADGSGQDRPAAGPTGPAPVAYPGPPPSTPPPVGWRPPVRLEVPPPRALPGQDHAAIEADEQSARTLTRGVGLIAGAVLLVVICLLCARVLF